MAEKQDKKKLDEDMLKNITQREAFNNAYAAIVGQQNIQSFSAFTLEEALDAQIERIEGKSTPLRPNLLERVERIKGNALKAIAEVRTIPPEQFILKEEEKDVNTPKGSE